MKDEIFERIQAGHRGLQISSQSRLTHIEKMEQALDSKKERAESPTSHRSRALLETLATGRRQLVRPPRLTGVGAVTMAVFVALALSAVAAVTYDGVPGDPYYYAKRVVEQPVGLVDRDLVASNRLAELEELVAREAEPPLILTARLDAARAVVGRPDNDEFFKTFNLLAWPGGLSESGLEGLTPAQDLLIPTSEWQGEGGYRSTLLDGNLVTVSTRGEQLVVFASGRWRSTETNSGWRLSNPQLDRAYDVQRVDGGLQVGFAEPTTSDRLQTVHERAALDPKQSGGKVANDDNPFAAAGGSDGQPSTTRLSPSLERGPAPEGAADPASSSSTTQPPPPNDPQPSSTTAAPTTTTAITATTTTTTATTTTTTATTTTTTTTPLVSSWTFYLRNPGNGDTTSSGTLSMATGSSPGGSLANFDTNRDGDPGLLIQKDGSGLSGNDSSKVQRWRSVTSSESRIAGQGSFTIWLAAKDFKTDEQIGVIASLELCTDGCVLLGTAQWSGQGTSGFQQARLTFGSVNRQIPEGAELRLKIAVPDALATTDVWFAYDAASYPSRVSLG